MHPDLPPPKGVTTPKLLSKLWSLTRQLVCSSVSISLCLFLFSFHLLSFVCLFLFAIRFSNLLSALYWCELVEMILSLRQYPGIAGSVCNRFLPAMEKDPHSLCSNCQGQECNVEGWSCDCCKWTDEMWTKVSEYRSKLAVQQE